MPFLENKKKIIAMKITKRLGLPNMCGWSICGWSQCGDENEFCGVYQQRRRRKGNGKNEPVKFGSIENFVMLPAWPVQPPSELRDFRQGLFVSVLESWQALTQAEKIVYNKIAEKYNKRGYDYYMSKTIKEWAKYQ